MRLLTAGGTWTPIDTASSFIDGGVGSAGSPVMLRDSLELIAGPDGSNRTVSYTQVYRSNPWLWASIQLVARGFHRMPVKVYEADANGNKKRVRPDSSTVPGSLAAVLRRPGDGRSWQSVHHATAIDRMVHGNAVWFPYRDRFGIFEKITRVPFRYVRCEKQLGVLRYWDARDPSKKRLADDVVHFGAWEDDADLFAPSPISAMQTTLTLYDAIERHLVGFFKNSARPSGHVEVDKSTGRNARKLIREAIERMYSGPDNAGKVLITSGKWVPLSQNPDHSRVIELTKQCREEIAAVIGVPPPLIGILDRAIMSNVRELRSHYARDVMGPHVSLFEGDLDAQLLAPSGVALHRIEVEVEMAAVMRPDIEARSSSFKNRRYVETMNEIRKTENLPRIDHPDADVPWMPMNEQPIGSDDAPGEKPDDNDGTDDDDPGMMSRTEET